MSFLFGVLPNMVFKCLSQKGRILREQVGFRVRRRIVKALVRIVIIAIVVT